MRSLEWNPNDGSLNAQDVISEAERILHEVNLAKKFTGETLGAKSGGMIKFLPSDKKLLEDQGRVVMPIQSATLEQMHSAGLRLFIGDDLRAKKDFLQKKAPPMEVAFYPDQSRFIVYDCLDKSYDEQKEIIGEMDKELSLKVSGARLKIPSAWVLAVIEHTFRVFYRRRLLEQKTKFVPLVRTASEVFPGENLVLGREKFDPGDLLIISRGLVGERCISTVDIAFPGDCLEV